MSLNTNKTPSPRNMGGRQEQQLNGQNCSTKQTKSQYVKTYFTSLSTTLQNAAIPTASSTFLKLKEIVDKYSNNDEEADNSFIQLLEYECDLILNQHLSEQIEALKKSKSKVTDRNQSKRDRKKEIEEGLKGLRKLDSKKEKEKVVQNLFTKRTQKKSKGIDNKYYEPTLIRCSREDIRRLSNEDKIILFAILGKILNPNYINLKTLYFKVKNFDGKNEWVKNLMNTNRILFNSLLNFIQTIIFDKKDNDKYEKLFMKTFNSSKYTDMNETMQNERKSTLIAQRSLNTEFKKFFNKYKSLFLTIFKYNTFDTFERKIFNTDICKEFREYYKNNILKHILIKDDGLYLIKVAYNLGLFDIKYIPKDKKEKCENKFVLLDLEKIRNHYNNSDKKHQLKYLDNLPAIFYGKGVSCQNKYGKSYLKYMLYDLSKNPLVGGRNFLQERELSFIDLSKCARNSNEYELIEDTSNWYDILIKLSYQFCPTVVSNKFITQQKIDFANILANSATVPNVNMHVLRSESNLHTALKNKLISCLTGTENEKKLKISKINKVFKFFNENSLFSIIGSELQFETWIKSNIINSKIGNQQLHQGLVTLKKKLEGTYVDCNDKWSEEQKIDNLKKDLEKNFKSIGEKTSRWSKDLLHEDNLPKDTNNEEINKYDKEYFDICSELGKNLTKKEKRKFSDLSNKDKLSKINKTMKEFIGSGKILNDSDNSIYDEEFPIDKYLEMKEKNQEHSNNTAIIIIKMWLQNNKISIQELIEKVKHILNPNENEFFLQAIKQVLVFYKQNEHNGNYSTHYRKYMKKCVDFFQKRIDNKMDVIKQLKSILSKPTEVEYKGMILVLIAHAKLESKNLFRNVYDFIKNLHFTGNGTDLVKSKKYFDDCYRNFPKVNDDFISNENIYEKLSYGETFNENDGILVHRLPESFKIDDISSFENLLLVAYENLNGLADDHLKKHLFEAINHLKELKQTYEENENFFGAEKEGAGFSYHGTKLKKVLHSSRKRNLISRNINANKITLPKQIVKILAKKKQERKEIEEKKAIVSNLFKKKSKKKKNKKNNLNQFEVISDTYKEVEFDEEEKEISEIKNNLYFSNSKIDIKKYLIQLEYFSRRNQIKELFSSLVEFYEKSNSEEKDSEDKLVKTESL